MKHQLTLATDFVQNVTFITFLNENTPLHSYFDEGENPAMRVERNCTGDWSGRVFITGYEVDKAQP